MVGDVTTTINAVEGIREAGSAPAHMGNRAVAAKGVAAGMLPDEHCFAAAGLTEQQILMSLLLHEGLLVGHQAKP